jgi:dihydroorotase
MGVHAEDETLLNQFRELGRGQTSPSHTLLRPPEAAVEAVRRLIDLCETWPRDVHICHLSTAAELELLRARRRRLPITVEVCTHHLWLSEQNNLGNWMKCNPPIRAEEDRLAMWEALEGEVDSLASDHAPHTREEKERGYWEAPSGIPGVETTLPLMLRGVWEGKLSLERLVALGAQRPAELFGLTGKGRVDVGMDADLVLVEPGKMRVLQATDLHTRVGWSPFTGWNMAAAPREVVVRGRTIAREGTIVAEAGSGRRIPLGPLTLRA